ncbi:hypothetical protein MSG28_007793, partial [Choristoneura fumiferana]
QSSPRGTNAVRAHDARQPRAARVPRERTPATANRVEALSASDKACAAGGHSLVRMQGAGRGRPPGGRCR